MFVCLCAQDFAALVIQYGFTVLFVAAFPLSPTLACVSSYIIIRINGWKLCQAFRRPQPKTAEDIGVWQDMLEILSALCTIYNFGLIFFTSHYLQDITWEYRWLMFIGAEHGMFILKFAIAAVVDDVPHEVDLQLQRQEFIVSKVIEGEPDEINEDFKPPDEKSNVMIGDTDYDWETDNGDSEDDDDDDEEEEEEEGEAGGGEGAGGGKYEDDED